MVLGGRWGFFVLMGLGEILISNFSRKIFKENLKKYFSKKSAKSFQENLVENFWEKSGGNFSGKSSGPALIRPAETRGLAYLMHVGSRGPVNVGPLVIERNRNGHRDVRGTGAFGKGSGIRKG